MNRARQILFFFPVLFLILPSASANAALELSYQYTSAQPLLVNQSSAFTTAEGTFATTEAKPNSTFTKFGDLYGALTFSRDPDSSLGVYYKTQLSKEVELKGYNSANVLQVTKTSALSGWVLGLVGKWFYLPEATRGLNFFFEAQVGAGKTNYKQNILDASGAKHSLNASAFVVDLNAYIGAQMPLYEQIDLVLKVGYSRLQSNYYSVDSSSGSRYTAVEAGKRMVLRTGEEVRLVRNGLAAQAGLALLF